MSMIDLLMGVLVPLVMFVVMTMIGTELTVQDFQRLLRFPRPVLFGTLAQIILLPVLAGFILLLLKPDEILIAGLIIFAACPGGGLSNILTSHGRGDVALSITLTAIGCLVGLLSIPFIISLGFGLFLDHAETIELPVLVMIGQLLLLVLMPVSLGMLLRNHYGQWLDQHTRTLNRLNAGLLVALIVIGFTVDNGLSGHAIVQAMPAAILFSIGACLAGFLCARLLSLNHADSIALIIEFIVRNGGIAILIVMVILQRPDLLAMPSACVMVQMIVAIVVVAIIRTRDRLQQQH